jgi:hypothetical protein
MTDDLVKSLRALAHKRAANAKVMRSPGHDQLHEMLAEHSEQEAALLTEAADALSRLREERGSSSATEQAPDGEAAQHSAGWQPVEGRRQRDPAGFVRLVQDNPGFWAWDFAVKYLNITIDTRDPAVFWLADRDLHNIHPSRVIDAIARQRARSTPAESGDQRPSEAKAATSVADEPDLPDPASLSQPRLREERPSREEWEPIPLTDDVLRYVSRYGGMCRDCADEHGVCPNSGLPCDDPRDKAIRHVITALNYGFGRGFLSLTQSKAVDSGEEDQEAALVSADMSAPSAPSASSEGL